MRTVGELELSWGANGRALHSKNLKAGDKVEEEVGLLLAGLGHHRRHDPLLLPRGAAHRGKGSRNRAAFRHLALGGRASLVGGAKHP